MIAELLPDVDPDIVRRFGTGAMQERDRLLGDAPDGETAAGRARWRCQIRRSVSG